MSKWFKISLVGLLVFGAVAVLISGIAFAQDDTTPAPDTALPHLEGKGFDRGLGGQVGLEAAANALGMTTEELSAELWAGKTLADIAEEKGVDLVELQATVQAAVQAERETAMREAINQAVENGTITQENADWLLEGLDKGFIPGFGFGLGGRGGFHGHGPGGGMFFGQPDAAPQTSPSGTSSGGA
jgi:hypothetical protein